MEAVPADALHVPSNVVSANEAHIKAAGAYKQDLSCYRSAWAKVWLINKEPFDKPYDISFYVNGLSQTDHIGLNSFSRDTIVYLKLVGNVDYNNYIRFNVSGRIDSTYKTVAAPWDTVSMLFYY